MNSTDIVRQAIAKFGVKHQLDMAQEEAAELIQAINKLRRNNLVYSDFVYHPHAASDINQIKAYSDLCSEIADIKIMIQQLELILDPNTIQIAYDKKIKRLQKLIGGAAIPAQN